MYLRERESIPHGLFSPLVCRVVGGMETLTEMESVPTEAEDKPQVHVFGMAGINCMF